MTRSGVGGEIGAGGEAGVAGEAEGAGATARWAEDTGRISANFIASVLASLRPVTPRPSGGEETSKRDNARELIVDGVGTTWHQR